MRRGLTKSSLDPKRITAGEFMLWTRQGPSNVSGNDWPAGIERDRSHSSQSGRGIYQVVVWYEDRELGVGLQLVEAYDAARLVIQERAERLPRLETARTTRDIRRTLLERFPFMIVFEVLAQEVVILAIAHFSQKPNYWSRRST